MGVGGGPLRDLMAERQEHFTVVCVANTPIATPVEIQTTLSPGTVASIEVSVPSGHASLTGLRFALGHTQIIPQTVGAWMVTNYAVKTLRPQGLVNSGAWSVFLYNTDINNHYWSITYDVDEVVALIPDGIQSMRTPEPRPFIDLAYTARYGVRS